MTSQGVHRACVVFIVGLFSARLVASSSSAPSWKDVRFFQARHLNLSPQQQPHNGISSAYRIDKKSPNVQNMSSAIVPKVKNNVNEVKIIASDNNIAVQNNKNDNVVAQLAKHIWTNVIVQFKQDVVQLYCNYQTCNDIKRQQRHYANQYTLEQRKVRKRYNGTTLSPLSSSSPASSNDYYVQTGLSYSQHGFLRQGQQDFIKTIRFALFLNAKILPFVLTLYPDSVIPSPFVHSKSGVQSENEKWSYAVQSRIHACLSTLCNVEQEITAPESASNANVLSLFLGGKQNNKQQEQLHLLKTITANLETQYLKHTQWNTEPRNAEDVLLHEDVYQEPPREDFLRDLASIACKPTIQQVPFTKAEKSLCDVPPSIVRGLSQMIFTCSPTSTTTGSTSLIGKQLGSILPLFIVRNRLTAHLEKLRQDDEFLMYEQKQPQSPLKFQDLREACHARCIGTSHDSFSSLSKKLSNWLTLEEKMMQQNPATSCYYNANVARAYMMCINALQSTAEDYNFGKIPRLLYTIKSSNVNSNRYHHME